MYCSNHKYIRLIDQLLNISVIVISSSNEHQLFAVRAVFSSITLFCMQRWSSQFSYTCWLLRSFLRQLLFKKRLPSAVERDSLRKAFLLGKYHTKLNRTYMHLWWRQTLILIDFFFLFYYIVTSSPFKIKGKCMSLKASCMSLFLNLSLSSRLDRCELYLISLYDVVELFLTNYRKYVLTWVVFRENSLSNWKYHTNVF